MKQVMLSPYTTFAHLLQQLQQLKEIKHSNRNSIVHIQLKKLDNYFPQRFVINRDKLHKLTFMLHLLLMVIEDLGSI